jgi:hypothetical protein
MCLKNKIEIVIIVLLACSCNNKNMQDKNIIQTDTSNLNVDEQIIDIPEMQIEYGLDLETEKNDSIVEKYDWEYGKFIWGINIEEFLKTHFISDYPSSTSYEKIKVYVFNPDPGVSVKNYFYEDRLFGFSLVNGFFLSEIEYTIEYIENQNGPFENNEEIINSENERTYKYFKDDLIIIYTIVINSVCL